jgi:hypothetical protein
MVENKKYPIDIDNGRIDCPNIEQRIGRLLANYAYKAGVELYESDIQWIENNITKNSQNKNRDILWLFEDYFSQPEKKYKSPYICDYVATFFESFIDISGIPDNVNRLLIVAVGRIRVACKKRDIMPYQHFFVETWLNKTQEGR